MKTIPQLQKYVSTDKGICRLQTNDFNLIGLNEKLQKAFAIIAIKNGFKIDSLSPNFINVKEDSTIKREGYRVEIANDITLTAKDYNGYLYGFQTIIKLFASEKEVEHCVIEDYPYLEERALHLDCGRKYFSPEWIKDLIQDLAWRNMNTLQLHFSDNKGFRIACETEPNVTSKTYLEKETVREIIDYAHIFGIEIIPSLDSPGHLKAALNNLPQFQLPNNDGNGLDITNRNARDFMLALYDEYAELFYDSRYFNIGGDEFIDFEKFSSYPFLKDYAINQLGIQDGEGIDTYLEFLNEMIKHLEDKNFIVRLWNDGLHRLNQKETVKLKQSAQICYWTKYNKFMAPLKDFENKKYELINYNADYFYYVLHVEAGVKIIDPSTWYETWHPKEFSGKQILENDTLLKGASYSIWCDAPEIASEKEIYEHTYLPLWAIADRMWNPKQNVRFNKLEKKISDINKIKTP